MLLSELGEEKYLPSSYPQSEGLLQALAVAPV